MGHAAPKVPWEILSILYKMPMQIIVTKRRERLQSNESEHATLNHREHANPHLGHHSYATRHVRGTLTRQIHRRPNIPEHPKSVGVSKSEKRTRQRLFSGGFFFDSELYSNPDPSYTQLSKSDLDPLMDTE